MRVSNVERRAKNEACVASANALLSSRYGQKYKVILRTSPGRVDKFVVVRHTGNSEQESRAVENTA